MVRGLNIFQEWFAAYADQYVLIGGTTASLTMEEAGLAFRATKDLDIVLHVEALTPAFPYWADPGHQRAAQINLNDVGRGLYWNDLNGHYFEIITRPSGSGG